MSGPRLDWDAILQEAAAIVNSYSTPVTLRQVHYRLVAAQVAGYENTVSRYTKLASKTAEARRAGWFPALVDGTRQLESVQYWSSVTEILRQDSQVFRLDRTIGQQFQVWVLYEKATLSAQINDWVEQYGIQRGALRGYGSEPLEREVWEQMDDDGRPAVVYYVGDLDPEGEDIERNFLDHAARAGVAIHHWERLAVTPQQEARLGLIPNFGKPNSKRAPGFIAKYGRLFQIEVEAVDPNVLERLVTKAIERKRWFNQAAFDAVIVEEQACRERLEQLADEEDAA